MTPSGAASAASSSVEPFGAHGRVALVTGANRGIGFEIVRQLGQCGFEVVLTARDEERGRVATRKLVSEGLQVVFEPLDVVSEQSVGAAIGRVEERYGRLDVLVNNAAISIDRDQTLLDGDPEILERTLETNFHGPLRLARAAVPLMKRHDYGRIVNVSSGQGSFAKLSAMRPCYRLSKAALNALTVVLADELKDTGILVNAMTPGWVKTRMVGFRAPRTPAEGADTVVWLATLAEGGPRGQFFKDREVFPW